MYLCHDVYKTWVCDVMSYENLRCSLSPRSANVALRVHSAISMMLFGLILPPMCNLACITVAFSMYTWVCPSEVVRFSSRDVHSLTPSSHRTMCFSSMPEYLRGCN